MDRQVLAGSLVHAAVPAAAFGASVLAEAPIAFAAAFALGLLAALLETFGRSRPVTPTSLFGFEELPSRVASGAVAALALCLIVATQPAGASEGLGGTAGNVVAAVAGALLLTRLPRFWASPTRSLSADSCRSISSGTACTASDR